MANYASGSILVSFKEGNTQESMNLLITSHGLTVKHFYEFAPGCLVTVPNGSEEKWCRKLRKEPEIVATGLNYKVYPA